MSLPEFAPFPEAKACQSILLEEWEIYLDSWVSLADVYLRLPDKLFSLKLTETESLTTFLVSFFHALASDDSILPRVLSLRKKCFLLVHRIYSGDEIPESLLIVSFLSDVSHAFPKNEHFRAVLQSLWKKKGAIIEGSLHLLKASIIKDLESKTPRSSEDGLNTVAPLLRASPDAGVYMLTGSDFLDSLSTAYFKVSASLQKKLATVSYLGLIALLEGQKPNYSLLSDHLYSLKTNGEQEQKSNTGRGALVADLITNTPLLNKIRDNATTPEAARAKNTAASLSVFHQPSIARPKRIIRRKADKGKGKAQEDGYGHVAFGEVHIHRMSMVSQIQDVFPDLGAGFVVKLLDEYNDNIEQVTAHLLEDSLPPHLSKADRSEKLPSTSLQSHLPPWPTPPLERRNVFDNDELDRLAVDASRLHIGRRNKQLTADKILSDRSNAPNKAAILSALAAFDSDDDERDDTYDAEDVGGTVDSAAPGADEVDADKNEESLFKAYTSNPELFARDTGTRRSKARIALKSETGMTDEAIEGWGIMIARDPKRLRRLEAKFTAFGGQQRELASTAYRGSPADSGPEAEEGSGDGQRGARGSGRGRGRGRGRGGGRGGNVAGPSDDKSTQQSRQRKEASKSSRANHNRRDQRARKMARGGLPG